MNASERKIYPLTEEIIDRAEENTAKNLRRYIEEERQKRQQMQESAPEKTSLTQQQIEEALNPKNLSAADKKLVEAWTQQGLTQQRMAELLIYEM